MTDEQIEKLVESMPTTEQKVIFAIYCGLEVCDDPIFVNWANKWLSGEDRSIGATDMAEAAVVALTAARAAERTPLAFLAAASAAIRAAKATKWTEEWAVISISWALKANPKINLNKLAKKAMEE